MSCNEVINMDDSKLHPSVQDFKLFLQKNPKLVMEVRLGKKSWQNIYEDWSLLGEEDEIWNAYKEESKLAEVESTASEITKTEFVSQLFNQLKKMDADQIQKHVSSLSQVLTAIQGVVSQFHSKFNPP